ncbi:MAG TPA: hypothetical protein VN688_16735 [Gemmataceae bacterium]|nr:hypothetical protein [Gemmataceae bacterium]
MHQDTPTDADIAEWLTILSVESLCQWDVLVFLYHHQTSLIGADYLARLLGYAIEPVISALDYLESLGFVGRSRVSQGARLYQFLTPTEPPRGNAFERLLSLHDHRAGRLALSKHMQRDQSQKEEERRNEEAKASASAHLLSLQHPLARKGGGKWQRVI